MQSVSDKIDRIYNITIVVGILLCFELVLGTLFIWVYKKYYEKLRP